MKRCCNECEREFVTTDVVTELEHENGNVVLIHVDCIPGYAMNRAESADLRLLRFLYAIGKSQVREVRQV